MIARQGLAAAAAAALTFQASAASAQQACLTEPEISAIAIYSLPSLVQSVRLRCNGQLSSSGYLARRGDALIARYAALQDPVWPRAKSGLLKVFASRAGPQQGQGLDRLANLPDNAVRPLVDALIVQELSPNIDVKNCGRIERLIEVASPIDPEVAGTLLGVVAGIVDHKDLPVCAPRRL